MQRLQRVGVAAQGMVKINILTELTLECCSLQEEHMPDLADALRCCEAVSRLNLKGNCIMNEGAKMVVSAVKESTSLQTLDLSHNLLDADDSPFDFIEELIQD